MNNPWVQHIFLIGAIHMMQLGVAKTPPLQVYVPSGVQWLESLSYFTNSILLVAIAWAWIHGRDTAAGFEFSDLIIPTVVGPATGFFLGAAMDVVERSSRE